MLIGPDRKRGGNDSDAPLISWLIISALVTFMKAMRIRLYCKNITFQKLRELSHIFLQIPEINELGNTLVVSTDVP